MSPTILIGAESSNSIGWFSMSSRARRHTILICVSVRFTNFPGLAPRALIVHIDGIKENKAREMIQENLILKSTQVTPLIFVVCKQYFTVYSQCTMKKQEAFSFSRSFDLPQQCVNNIVNGICFTSSYCVSSVFNRYLLSRRHCCVYGVCCLLLIIEWMNQLVTLLLFLFYYSTLI